MKKPSDLDKTHNFQWKRILLIKPNYATKGWDFYNLNFPPLNLAYIAGYIVDLNVEVQILDTKAKNLDYKQIKKKIEKFNPDLVGISVSLSSSINVCYDIAKIVKEINQNCKVVFGGRHATFESEETLKVDEVDIIVRGEGELTFRELIIKGTPENVRGISYKFNSTIIHNDERPLMSKNDYAKINFPARQLLKNTKYKAMGLRLETMETSRGCPFRCKFCATANFYHQNWRPRPIESLIAELKVISKNSKISDIFFVDDNLTNDVMRIEEFCKRIIESKERREINDFKFFAQVRVDDIVRAPQMVKAMGNAGFWIVFIGIESVRENSLKAMRKKISFNKTLKAIEILHKNGIITVGNLIIGFDLNATEEDIKEEIQLMKKVDIDLVTYALLTPFPGADIFQELDQKELIVSKDWSKYTILNPVIKTYQLSSMKLYELLLYSFHELGYFRSYLATARRIVKRRGITFFLNPIRLILLIKSFLQLRSLSIKVFTSPSGGIRKLLKV